MSRVTEAEVLKYIAEAAASILEDDLNEGGMPEEEFNELRDRAWDWIAEHR